VGDVVLVKMPMMHEGRPVPDWFRGTKFTDELHGVKELKNLPAGGRCHPNHGRVAWPTVSASVLTMVARLMLSFCEAATFASKLSAQEAAHFHRQLTALSTEPPPSPLRVEAMMWAPMHALSKFVSKNVMY
jgi:hypothetical protein